MLEFNNQKIPLKNSFLVRLFSNHSFDETLKSPQELNATQPDHRGIIMIRGEKLNFTLRDNIQTATDHLQAARQDARSVTARDRISLYVSSLFYKELVRQDDGMDQSADTIKQFRKEVAFVNRQAKFILPESVRQEIQNKVKKVFQLRS